MRDPAELIYVRRELMESLYKQIELMKCCGNCDWFDLNKWECGNPDTTIADCYKNKRNGWHMTIDYDDQLKEAQGNE